MGAIVASISSGKLDAGISTQFTLAPVPAGLAVGDLLVTIWGASVTTGGATIFEPAGFTKVTQDNPPSINFPKAAIAWKIAAAPDLAGNWLYTQSTGFSPSWSVSMYRITGHDAANPIDGLAKAFVDNIIQATMPTPSLVTTADNVLILRVPVMLTAGAVPTDIVPPAGITELAQEIAAVGGIACSFAVQDALVTPPGGSGVETFTHNGSGANRAVLYTLGIAPVPVFSTPEEAETRAYALVADGTWNNAHYSRAQTGEIVVRCQRFMSPAQPDNGAWVEIDDPATV